ncbi:VOC family protein [Cellulomonas sp. GbtcB1]|uniref:VOC family protein n=1 Tax=Cellulomonas sp. GbtcB1 TaxID=2824746 RepID=UPI001C3118AF
MRDVVVDCRHPASLARWWAGTLDGYRVAPYDEAELARRRAAGIDDPEDDPTVLVEPVVADHGAWLVLADPEGDEFCVFPA